MIAARVIAPHSGAAPSPPSAACATRRFRLTAAVAFDWHGDLWVCPGRRSGRARHRDPAHEQKPCWSRRDEAGLSSDKSGNRDPSSSTWRRAVGSARGTPRRRRAGVVARRQVDRLPVQPRLEPRPAAQQRRLGSLEGSGGRRHRRAHHPVPGRESRVVPGREVDRVRPLRLGLRRRGAQPLPHRARRLRHPARDRVGKRGLAPSRVPGDDALFLARGQRHQAGVDAAQRVAHERRRRPAPAGHRPPGRAGDVAHDGAERQPPGVRARFDLYSIDVRVALPAPKKLSITTTFRYDDPAESRTYTAGFRTPAWSPREPASPSCRADRSG